MLFRATPSAQSNLAYIFWLTFTKFGQTSEQEKAGLW